MSTPIDLNVVMPYGVTLEGNGSKLPQIVGSHPKRRSSISLNIPSGPCRVGLSWDGPEGIQLLHYSGGSQRIIAGEITAKTGGVTPNHCLHRSQGRRLGAVPNLAACAKHLTRHSRSFPHQLRVATTAGAVV